MSVKDTTQCLRPKTPESCLTLPFPCCQPSSVHSMVCWFNTESVTFIHVQPSFTTATFRIRAIIIVHPDRCSGLLSSCLLTLFQFIFYLVGAKFIFYKCQDSHATSMAKTTQAFPIIFKIQATFQAYKAIRFGSCLLLQLHSETFFYWVNMLLLP